MYYRSETGSRCCICTETLRAYPPGGSTFLHEMTSFRRVKNVTSKIEYMALSNRCRGPIFTPRTILPIWVWL